jgi:hypothetical protein
MAEGLVVYPAGIPPLNNAIIVCPPLVITQAEVGELLRRLDRGLAVIEAFLDERCLKPARTLTRTQGDSMEQSALELGTY